MSLATFRTDLSHFLANAGLGLTEGTNLFRGMIPAEINPATLVVLVMPTGGPQSSRFLATYPTYQITVRGRDLDAAEAKAMAIFALFDNLEQPVAMGPTPGSRSRVADCKALQPPFLLPGRDERECWRWVCNYMFTLSD